MISKEASFRVICSIISAELQRLRSGDFDRSRRTTWSSGMPIGQHGIDADSLELIGVATAVSSFYCLHESGVEDRLLVDRTLGHWVDIAHTVASDTEHLTFHTSGSTAAPKAIDHLRTGLLEDARWFARYCDGVQRVISLVPPHHLYGFVHTVLVPQHIGAEVIDAEFSLRTSIMRKLTEGDLLVATPTMWAELARCGMPFPHGVRGVSSGEPLPKELCQTLLSLGLTDLYDVFGSTETSLLGVRTASQAEYTAREHKRLQNQSNDNITFNDDGTFTASGRVDGVVQVGGVNISPEVVEGVLRVHPGVEACAVKVTRNHGTARVSAFIVPSEPADIKSEMIGKLRKHAASQLPAPARPVTYTFGSSIPRSPMGKVQAWQETT